MTVQSKYCPSAINSTLFGGTVAWVNPAQAQGIPDSLRANVLLSAEQYSRALLFTGWGWNIPRDAQITGIQIDCLVECAGTSYIQDAEVLLAIIESGQICTMLITGRRGLRE
jgi:hypothetical protein